MREFLYQLTNKDRIGILDTYRAIAIIVVVIFHFNMDVFPLGYVGVDLFFVISGYLVSQPLLKSCINETSINTGNFLLRRGFKIWPSYYFFLLVCIPLSYLLFKDTDPTQLIPGKELIWYLLFLSNYFRGSLHFSFDMNWSLCVEEHFYLILAFAFFLVPHILKKVSWRNKALLIIIVLICSSILFKFIGYFFKIGEYVNYTHNRLDALGLGVLIAWVQYFQPERFKKNSRSIFLFCIGAILLVVTVILYYITNSSTIYELLIIHNLAPWAFFLMIGSTLGYQFKVSILIRFTALISYNLYLWHSIIGVYIKLNLKDFLFLDWLLYLSLSFAVAFLATITIENYFIGIRSKLLKTPVKA